jgi:hypothetical protein
MAEESESPLSEGDFDLLASDKLFEQLQAGVSPFTNALALTSGIKAMSQNGAPTTIGGTKPSNDAAFLNDNSSSNSPFKGGYS